MFTDFLKFIYFLVKTKPVVWVAFITVSSPVFLQVILIRICTMFSNSVRLFITSKEGSFQVMTIKLLLLYSLRQFLPSSTAIMAVGYETT